MPHATHLGYFISAVGAAPELTPGKQAKRRKMSRTSVSVEGKESSEKRATMCRPTRALLPLITVSIVALSGCDDLVPHDTRSLFLPQFQRSEIVGFIAGLGTTFAAFPDLLAMLRRRSTAGMNPRMAGIMGAFQILWVYYGLLIASRPVVLWNVIAVAPWAETNG